MTDSASPIKKHNQQHLHLWLTHPCLFLSAHTVLPICLVKHLICLCEIFTKFAAKFHTHTHTILQAFEMSLWNFYQVGSKISLSLSHTHTHTHISSSTFIVTLSLIRQTVCALAQFSRCSSTTNAHSKTGQMAMCCQNLMLGALSSHSAPCAGWLAT